MTPASSKWEQSCIPSGLEVQSTSRASVPVHPTWSRRMAPVPWPKKARTRATAPVIHAIQSDISHSSRKLGITTEEILQISAYFSHYWCSVPVPNAVGVVGDWHMLHYCAFTVISLQACKQLTRYDFSAKLECNAKSWLWWFGRLPISLLQYPCQYTDLAFASSTSAKPADDDPLQRKGTWEDDIVCANWNKYLLEKIRAVCRPP